VFAVAISARSSQYDYYMQNKISPRLLLAVHANTQTRVERREIVVVDKPKPSQLGQHPNRPVGNGVLCAHRRCRNHANKYPQL